MCHFLRRNCKPQASHNVQSGSTAQKRVGIASKQSDKREQFKSNQEHIPTHIFINLVTQFDFLQLQAYTNMQQASGFGSNFTRISFQKFSYVVSQLQLILHIQGIQLIPTISYILASYTLTQPAFSQRQLKGFQNC